MTAAEPLEAPTTTRGFVEMHPAVARSAERPARRRTRLLFTDLVDVRWLTGFTGSNGWAVLRADELVVGTDGRYGERAPPNSPSRAATVAPIADRPARTGRCARSPRPAVRSRSAREIGRASTPLVSSPTATPTAPDVLAPRADLVLEPTEVAGQAAERRSRTPPRSNGSSCRCRRSPTPALADVEPMLFATTDSPVTEADVRDELEYRMRRHGADDRSYDTIVASGPRLPRPHHETAHARTIVEGDTVIIDVGALVDGYHSDMTRTSYVVGEPTQQRARSTTLVASAAGGRASPPCGPGVAAARVDARPAGTCSPTPATADWFIHGTGHGVGLEIHEEPFAAATSTAVLVEGDVVTVEPGLYRDGFGGVRIEDLVTVTETGCRILTQLSKDTPCLPSRPTT